jgi:hypothetical protein
MDWYHGELSREETEQALLVAGCDFPSSAESRSSGLVLHSHWEFDSYQDANRFFTRVQ